MPPNSQLVVTDLIRQELARREFLKKDLLAFTQLFEPHYLAGWVHKDICHRLERFSREIIDGRSPRLMLLMPPRHGKSLLASQIFPAWHLGHRPDHEVINVGYNVDLPTRFSRRVREILQQEEYDMVFPDTKLDTRSQSVEAWLTTKRGGFTASGRGGGITGKGANCVIPYCKVTTKRGKLPIKDVKVGDEVLGYDHGTEKNRWTRVRAVSANCLSDQKVCRTGNLETTADHKLYTRELGYIAHERAVGAEGITFVTPELPGMRGGVRAQNGRNEPSLQTGAKSGVLLRNVFPHSDDTKIKRPGLPAVRQQESEPCGGLHGVLRDGSKKVPSSISLRSLWRGVFSRSSGPSAEFRSWAKTCILFDGLFQRRQAFVRSTRSYEFLYTLWQTSKEKVLWFVLLPRTSQSRYAVLFGSVAGASRLHYAAGSTNVPNVLVQEVAYGGTPYRSRRYALCSRESDSAVRKMPWRVSQEQGFSAKSLARGVYADSEYVVDLQTTTENFFCEGILVHNCLIIDDPIKNMEEADNFEIREKLEDWYFSTAYTRLAPGGGVLLIETMWNFDDLAGRLMAKMELEEEVDQFEVIRYPAISTEYEYRNKDTYEMERSDIPLISLTGSGQWELLREPGVALHEVRYSLEYLERVKANMASRIFSALYQQNPVPEEGLFFRQEWIHLSPNKPVYSNRRFFIAWDFAISQKQRADYTVGACLMQDEHDNLYLVDLVRFKGDTQRICHEFISMIQRWSQFEGSSIQLGVEDGQIWKSLRPILKAQMREERAYVSIETMQALTDKESRARALQGRMEHRRFWFFEDSPWLQDVQRELLRFPAGRHDDIVDALAWAVRLATGKQPKKRPLKKKMKSWKDNLGKFMGASNGGGHLSA